MTETNFMWAVLILLLVIAGLLIEIRTVLNKVLFWVARLAGHEDRGDGFEKRGNFDP
jgi:hypothetical protein